jgi:hypothetical protein
MRKLAPSTYTDRAPSTTAAVAATAVTAAVGSVAIWWGALLSGGERCYLVGEAVGTSGSLQFGHLSLVWSHPAIHSS